MPISTRPSFSLAAALAGLAIVAAGCEPGPGGRPVRDRPLVVTSLFPIQDFARRIGGDAVEVRCLVPPGADPHALQGTPGTAKWVADADLVLLMGLGMDRWVEKLARGESGVRVAVVSEGLPIRSQTIPSMGIRFGSDGEHGNGTVESQDPSTAVDPDGAGVDPHVWLDPVLAVELARRIGSEMERTAPELREVLARGTASLVAELEALDAAFSRGLEKSPRRQVVTFHGAFAYLFARYGLETVAVIEPFPGDEPSAVSLRELVELTRRLGIRAIMAEPQLPDGPARTIAREIGGVVERLDPCESALPEAPDTSYTERQRRNLAVLQRVLAPPGGSPGEIPEPTRRLP